ncbi:Cytochrome c oxidase subunit VIIa [Nesidiocoris tenuis]|uniref:Cytochrome c oxidase subunit VIIa n=1 Tax=Nesidiocoris tenuis TaxID=355587 RepID=A0ABN7APV4_9HEMI|nr:Cytochrome c oxidase subunit VIIa [Nesidiocoris tenuis]
MSQITRFAVNSARIVQQQKVLRVPFRCMAGANPAIKSSQEKFQSDDNVPIFLKGGVLDQILYRTTMGLCVAAIGLFIYNIRSMAVKK